MWLAFDLMQVRSAVIAAVGQALLAAVMAYAAFDSTGQERATFGALAAGAGLGAIAAALLSRAVRRSNEASARVNQATLFIGLSFCAGALGAVLAGNPLVLALPVVVLLIDGMLVGAARKVQSN